MTARVGDVMTALVLTVGPNVSVGTAAATMERERVGCLAVTEGERLVGILTSRDVRRCHPNRLVADAMSRPVVQVAPEASIWAARDLLDRHGIERLIVVDDFGRPAGIVTKAQVCTEIGKHHDVLTGLPGSAYLRREAARLLREGREIAVIFIDLDGFGEIDKSLGHVAGDEILRRAGRVLAGAVDADHDHLCRYGGDEFAVVTTRAFPEARALALRLVGALADADWPGGVRITASAGLAGGRRESSRPDGDEEGRVGALINMASLASTAAKKKKAPVVAAGRVALEEAL